MGWRTVQAATGSILLATRKEDRKRASQLDPLIQAALLQTRALSPNPAGAPNGSGSDD